MFVMSSMWDLYQLRQMKPSYKKAIQLPPKLSEEVKYLEAFANNSYRSVTRVRPIDFLLTFVNIRVLEKNKILILLA